MNTQGGNMDNMETLNKKKAVLEYQIKLVKENSITENHHPRLILDLPTLEKELCLIENEIQNLSIQN